MGKHSAAQCELLPYTFDIDDPSFAISKSFFCCSVHFYSDKCINQESIKGEKGSQLLTLPQAAM